MRSTLFLVVTWTLSSKRGHLTLGLQLPPRVSRQKKRQNKVSKIRKFQKSARSEGQREEEGEGNHQGMMQEKLGWQHQYAKCCDPSDGWKYGDDRKSDGISPLSSILLHAFLLFLADSYLLLYICLLFCSHTAALSDPASLRIRDRG